MWLDNLTSKLISKLHKGLFGSAFPRGFQLFGLAFGSILGGMLAFGMLWNAEGGFNEFFSSNIALTDN